MFKGDKKGYFFTIDAFVAISVAVIGFSLILSSYTFEPNQVQPVFYSDDLMDILYASKIYEFNADNILVLKECKENGTITDFDSTLAEQVVVFIEDNENGICDDCIDEAERLIEDVFTEKVSGAYSYNITFTNEDGESFRIFDLTKFDTFGKKRLFDDSKVVTSSKRIISSVVDHPTDGEKLVIYSAEALVWQ